MAVLSGAASVTASSYGSWITYQPQYDPVNAFDGNSETAWTEGSPTTPVGQWIQITFNHSVDLPASIGVQLLVDNINRSVANELQVSTARGKAMTTVLPTNATQALRVPPGPTTSLRITILGASNDVPGNPGAGIREVQIPGVTVTRYLKPAQSSAGAAAPSVAFSFDQAPPTPAGSSDIAATVPIARTFSLSSATQLQLTASAVAQPSGELNSLIGKLAPPGQSTLQVSASSTWGALPMFGPDNLFTSATTPWISGSSDPTISLKWQGNRTISKIVVQTAFGFTAAPPEIMVTSPAGTSEATVSFGGVAVLNQPLTTNQITISFPGWAAAKQPGTGAAQPVLGLAKLAIPALSGLQVGAPDPATPFNLGCGQGPPITLDGQTIQTAVSGTLGDLEGELPVQVHLCTPGSTEGGSGGSSAQADTVTMSGGSHRLVAQPGLFTMTDVTLQSMPAVTSSTGTASSTAPSRALNVLSWQADNRTVRIGAGQESYIEVHQNANPGWVATLNGKALTPAVLDGWQQAFVVPAGAGGVITMTFQPAGVYHAALVLSLLALLVLVVVARLRRKNVPPAARRRARSRHRGHSRSAPTRHRAVHDLSGNAGNLGWAARWAGLTAVAVLIFMLGGPVVLALPVLVLVAAAWPRLLPLISLVAMLAAGVIAAAGSGHPTLGFGAFGPNAQACALVALAAALYPHRPWPVPADEPQWNDQQWSEPQWNEPQWNDQQQWNQQRWSDQPGMPELPGEDW